MGKCNTLGAGAQREREKSAGRKFIPTNNLSLYSTALSNFVVGRELCKIELQVFFLPQNTQILYTILACCQKIQLLNCYLSQKPVAKIKPLSLSPLPGDSKHISTKAAWALQFSHFWRCPCCSWGNLDIILWKWGLQQQQNYSSGIHESVLLIKSLLGDFDNPLILWTMSKVNGIYCFKKKNSPKRGRGGSSWCQ